MKLSRMGVAIVGILVMFFVAALVFYPQMPEQMASHWNASGDADGYMGRFWGVFLLPFVTVGLVLLFLAIPRIDPLKANIDKFKNYYYGFVIAFMVFFLYVYVLTLLWNVGLRFDFTQVMIPAMGLLFIAVGVMTGKAKRNYFIGIRTPWTLANDEVWNRTHRLGGRLFKIAGVLMMAGVFFPDLFVWFIFGAVLPAALVPIVYSYIIYGKLVNGRGTAAPKQS